MSTKEDTKFVKLHRKHTDTDGITHEAGSVAEVSDFAAKHIVRDGHGEVIPGAVGKAAVEAAENEKGKSDESPAPKTSRRKKK